MLFLDAGITQPETDEPGNNFSLATGFSGPIDIRGRVGKYFQVDAGIAALLFNQGSKLLWRRQAPCGRLGTAFYPALNADPIKQQWFSQLALLAPLSQRTSLPDQTRFIIPDFGRGNLLKLRTRGAGLDIVGAAGLGL